MTKASISREGFIKRLEEVIERAEEKLSTYKTALKVAKENPEAFDLMKVISDSYFF